MVDNVSIENDFEYDHGRLSRIPSSDVQNLGPTSTLIARYSKKTNRTSWTKLHTTMFKDKGITRRKCLHCSVIWASSSSTGTITKHLLNAHKIKKGDAYAEVNSLQSTIKTFKRLSVPVEKTIDSLITEFIVTETLPHILVESQGWKKLLGTLAPKYTPKPVQTVKRSILQMYVVLRHMIIDLLAKTMSRFSITFDGWSSNSHNGFFYVKLHWVSQDTGKMHAMILDFFNVFPDKGMGKLCGFALFQRLKTFGISGRLLAFVADSDNDAQVATMECSRLIKLHHGKEILQSNHTLRCIVRTFQLAIESAMKVIAPQIHKLRHILVMFLTGKLHRKIFKRIAMTIIGEEREPPIPDYETRWNSTMIMLSESLHLHEILSAAISNDTITEDFSGYLLSSEDWHIITKLLKWMESPAKILKLLCGSEYPTLTLAYLAYNKLFEHCNMYQVKGSMIEDQSDYETQSQTLTYPSTEENVLELASKACLQYLIKYHDDLKSIPARIAYFLDPRVSRYDSIIKNQTDIMWMEEIMNNHYNMVASEFHAMSSESEAKESSISLEYLWDDIGRSAYTSFSKSRSEIECFMKQPQECHNVDPLEWWFSHKVFYPRMYRMACDYLGVPSSSKHVEEINFVANTLNVETFKAELCIKSWLETLQAMGIVVPQDYNIAYETLNLDLKALAVDDEIISYMLRDM